MNKEEDSYFLSNLDKYQPKNIDYNLQKQNIFKLYGIFETDEKRKKEEYKKMQFSKEFHPCSCKKESIFNINDATKKTRSTSESIYVCNSTKKYRIYHTTTN